MIFWILLIVYLLFALLFFRSFGYNCSLNGGYLDYSPLTILASLFFPITLIAIPIYNFYFQKWGYKNYPNYQDVKFMKGDLYVRSDWKERNKLREKKKLDI